MLLYLHQQQEAENVTHNMNKSLNTVCTLHEVKLKLSSQIFLHYKLNTIDGQLPSNMFRHYRGAIIRESLC